MGTQRQKKLAKMIVKNAKLDKPLNAGELLESSGYSKSSAEASPGVIIAQVGVQEELKALGFTEDNAKKVVESIMLDDEVDASARLKATDQVFKVHGSYAPERQLVKVDVNSYHEYTNEELERISKESAG